MIFVSARIEFLSVMMSASKLTESAKSVMKLISLWGDECDFIPRSWVGGAPTTFVELEKYSILFSERTPDIVNYCQVFLAIVDRNRTGIHGVLRKESAWLVKKSIVL